jgi:chaperonin cofactor prefoldin
MVNAELLVDKDNTIVQMKETIEILELKIKKLEQLVKLKDSKIANLSGKLSSMGI